jgi:site-specific recombinase XerD
MRRDIDDYLAYALALGRSDNTVAVYRTRLHRFRDFAIRRGIVRTRDVFAETVRAYHDEMRRGGLQASSRLGHLSAIRSFLTWAYESERLPTDVATRIELPRPAHKLPPRPLTRQDMVQLLHAFSLRVPAMRRTRAMLELFYACGLRKAELLALSVGDVDFVEKTVLVRSGKGNKGRLLPVHKLALRALKAYLPDETIPLARGTPLFTTMIPRGVRGKRLDQNNVAGIFRVVKRRFHKHVYPHLLRHTFAVHMLQGGAGLRHVQALLGHESPNTTSRYLGLVKDDIKKTYDRAMQKVLHDKLAQDQPADGSLPPPRRQSEREAGRR